MRVGQVRMSDARLRELERKWKETGAVGDEAAYLLERMRVGDVTRDRLEFAAYCGHEAARRVVGGESGQSGPEQLLAGVTSKRWGADMTAEALRAALEVCGAAFERAGELTPPHRTSTALGEVKFTAQRLGAAVEGLASATLKHLVDRILASSSG
jgi:hypothetical protein